MTTEEFEVVSLADVPAGRQPRGEKYLALKALLWSLYHRGERKGLAIRDIERETGIPKSSLQRAADTVRRSVQGIEERAQSRLGDLFERTGLVGLAVELT
jgi:hypothetical protein